jgi:hypothetical protein
LSHESDFHLGNDNSSQKGIWWIWLVLCVPFTAHAQSSPAAIKCVEKFLVKMKEIKGYSTRIIKKELVEGEWVEDTVHLEVDGPTSIKYTFSKPGSSGIRNNGMQLIYDGSDTLKIVWGEASGFGVIAKRAARAVIGDTLPMTGDTALKGELFTLNHAGYGHFAHSLRYHLPSIKLAKQGGIVGEGCVLKYTPPNVSYLTIPLAKDGRIQDIEERYGVYAMHLRQVNSEKFKDMDALFNRKTDVELKVPDFLLPFEAHLNADSLPDQLTIYMEGEKVGEYTFEEIKTF